MIYHRLSRGFALLFFLLASGGLLLAQEETPADTSDVNFFALSLDDLLSIEVVTASNANEKLNRAPATIVVVTEQDIRERGYLEFYDLLNDLPGFDLSRAYGDDNYYTYVRGFRRTLSDQTLFMIDGVIMNHLYNNNMNAFYQYPMYNIKQVEIVYGPASAVYGANAFTGVINIITKKEGKSSLFLSKGGPNSNLVDMNISRKYNELIMNITGRLYHSNGVDFSNRTPFLTDTLFTSPHLWGPFQATDFLGYNSPMNSNYLSANVQFKGLTVGTINWFSETGLGTEFPADKVLNAGKWQFDEQSFFARYENKFGKLGSKTLMRFRQSGYPESSLFIENYKGKSDASYWHATNRAWSLFQDFTYNISDKLDANFGLKYYRRNLQRAYDINYGPSIDQSLVMDEAYPYPEMPYRGSPDQGNHGGLEDQGVYAQLKYKPSEKLDVIMGMRYDHNSVWKGVFSPRVGIVAEPVSGLIAKAFYGTAFLEPAARVLYGGWQGSLSNPDVKPERMQTFEASAAYTKGVFSVGGDFYANTGTNVIAQDENKRPINLGKRSMVGGDVFVRYMSQNPMGFINRLKADVYLSLIDSKEAATDTDPFVVTGNIAPFKYKGVFTAYMFDDLSLSFQTRYISQITTVESNPLGTIGSWFVTDANISYNNLLTEGLSIGLKVYNLFNADYFHPGYRDASAGETLYINGVRQDSGGWYNSRLPQAFRQAHLSLRFDF